MIKKFIVFIIAVLVIAGLIFALKNKREKTQTNNPSAASSSTNTPTSSSTENHPFGFTSISKEEADVAKEVGITIVRASIGWTQIEPKEGKFNFDKFTGDGQGSEFTPLVRFRTGNDWATKCKVELCKPGAHCPREEADCPPKDLGAWTEKGYSPLLYDLVYKTLEYGKTKGLKDQKIIVGNEVNTPAFWLGSIDDYVKTRGTIYKAVQDANNKYGTHHQVIDNGFASGVWAYALIRDEACGGKINDAQDFAKRFFRRLYPMEVINQQIEEGGDCNKEYQSQIQINTAFAVDPNLKKPSFDYMSYHFYEPWDTQEEIINFIKGKMKTNGYDRPILNTEGGFADKLRENYDKYPAVKTDVANDIPKIHTIAFANGIQSFLWLPLIENYTGETFGMTWKGLELPNRAKLPAYESYKTMTSKLDGYSSVEKMNGFSTEYAFKYNFKSKKPVYVFWDTKDNSIDFSKTIKGEVRATKVDGSSQNISSSKISVGESPIYVEEN